MGKSKFSSRTIGPNRDDRKHVNRSDRKKIKECLAEGQYEDVPSEQKLKKKRISGISE